MIYKKINKKSNELVSSLFNEYRNQPLLVELYTEESTLDVATYILKYKNIFLTLDILYLKNKKTKEVRCYNINSFKNSSKKISKEEFLNLCSDVPDFSDWILFNIDKIK